MIAPGHVDRRREDHRGEHHHPRAPRTVVTVRPGRTRTVTRVIQADEPRVPGSLSSDFATSGQVDATPYFGAHPNLYFVSPSGNIGCYIVNENGNYAECTIAQYDFDEPGYDCPKGATVTASDGSSGDVDCASYEVDGSGRVLGYGKSIINGDMACVSRPSGVSCASTLTGSGFTLSREQVLPRY